MFEGTFAALNIAYTLRSVGPSFFTLFASGEAGCITSRSEGVGTNSRFSESGFFSRGLIQSSAIRSSRIPAFDRESRRAPHSPHTLPAFYSGRDVLTGVISTGRPSPQPYL
jgi:hypothetical protein